MSRLLVIQTAFPGDIILTLPMMQALKQKHPQSSIDVVTTPVGKEIFASSPYVNDVFVLDKKGKHKSLLSTISFARKLSSNKYDELYSPHRSFRSSLISRFVKAGKSYGFNTASFKRVYDELVRYDKTAHEVKRDLDLTGYKGDWRIKPEMKCAPEEKEAAERFLAEVKKGKDKVVVIAPGSVWNTKQYPEEHFAGLARKLLDKNYGVIFTGSKKELELCNGIARESGGGAVAAGLFSIPGSVEMMSGCDAVICNDSAPTHMAMAAGTPALTIYCSTVPDFGFYPYLHGSGTAGIDLECKPCGIHGFKECPLGHFKCGRELTPDAVLQELENIIGGKGHIKD